MIVSIDEQSPDIAMGVDKALEQKAGTGDAYDEVGAGDQGMMFGYACDETDALMPMPIWLAHRMADRLAEVRKDGIVDFLRPDGKTQVSVEYEDGVPERLDTVLISTQHDPGVSIDGELRPALIEHVIRPSLPEQFADDDFEIFVNPTGQFELGGPHADCGLTGRKIIVDTYGGMARHGGGAFSGKDPTKVDRSAAYAVRQIAKAVVAAGLAKRCEAQVAYAIGVAHPVSIMVDTFGTSEIDADEARSRGARGVRHAARRDHRAARPAAPDLPAHRRVRPLRPHRRRRASRGRTSTATPPSSAARPARRRPRPRVPRVCRVVPDVTAVERVFDYLVPDALAARVRVGTIVRVPLHGRRVRGWVVADDVDARVRRSRLLELLAVVSEGPPAGRRRTRASGSRGAGAARASRCCARHRPRTSSAARAEPASNCRATSAGRQ